MDDEIIVLHEICKKLTNNKKDYNKLYNDYLYLTRNGRKYYSTKTIFKDNKPKEEKTVKASEFYKWIVENQKYFVMVNTSYIPQKYKTKISGADFELKNLILPDYEEIAELYIKSINEIERLNTELADLKPKAEKYDSWCNKKGKKRTEKNSD